MTKPSENPFKDIESALEYTNLLLETAQETHGEIEADIACITDPRLARRKQALQLVSHKLAQLSSHITTSRRILNDLRTLRRLLLEEREALSEKEIQPKKTSPRIKV